MTAHHLLLRVCFYRKAGRAPGVTSGGREVSPRAATAFDPFFLPLLSQTAFGPIFPLPRMAQKSERFWPGPPFGPDLSELWGAQRLGSPTPDYVGAPNGGEPRRVVGSKFHAFCSLSRPKLASFLLSLVSRGLVVLVQGHGPLKLCVWASLGSFCVSPGGLQTSGVSHTGENGAGEGKKKKSEKLGGPAELSGGEAFGPNKAVYFFFLSSFSFLLSPFFLLPVFLSSCLPVFLSSRLPVCPSARLPVCPSARLPVCPSARLFFSFSFFLFFGQCLVRVAMTPRRCES